MILSERELDKLSDSEANFLIEMENKISECGCTETGQFGIGACSYCRITMARIRELYARWNRRNTSVLHRFSPTIQAVIELIEKGPIGETDMSKYVRERMDIPIIESCPKCGSKDIAEGPNLILCTWCGKKIWVRKKNDNKV